MKTLTALTLALLLTGCAVFGIGPPPCEREMQAARAERGNPYRVVTHHDSLGTMFTYLYRDARLTFSPQITGCKTTSTTW